MNIKAVVVDDEKAARLRIIELLQRKSDIELVGTASNGQEALDVVRGRQPDLLFLDVQMPHMDGLTVLQQLDPDSLPITILVTAFDKYALQAFNANAIDYLLKPFTDERFDDALRRARRYLQASDQSAAQVESHSEEEPLEGDTSSGYLDRLALKSNGYVNLLNLDDVDWIEAAGVYVYLHAGTKRHLYRSSMTQLLQRLDPRRFVRIHRSAAVKTDRIRQLQALAHGDFTLILNDGRKLTLSRAYRPQIEAWLRQRI